GHRVRGRRSAVAARAGRPPPGRCAPAAHAAVPAPPPAAGRLRQGLAATRLTQDLAGRRAESRPPRDPLGPCPRCYRDPPTPTRSAQALAEACAPRTVAHRPTSA